MNLSQFDWNFRLFGVKVRVMATFWLLCLVFSPFLTQKSGGDRPWLFGALGWAAAVLLSFLLHEFGHALVGRRVYRSQPLVELGIGASKAGAPVFGGITTQLAPLKSPSARERALVAAAGPIAALAGAAVLLLAALLCGCSFAVFFDLGFVPVPLPLEWVKLIGGNSALALFFGYFVYGFLWIGIFWSVVNLLPIFPMDGGQIVMTLATAARGKRGRQRAFVVSIVCSALVALAFVLQKSYFAAFFFGYLTFVNYQTMKAYENWP